MMPRILRGMIPLWACDWGSGEGYHINYGDGCCADTGWGDGRGCFDLDEGGYYLDGYGEGEYDGCGFACGTDMEMLAS